jgi:hypothetical protein
MMLFGISKIEFLKKIEHKKMALINSSMSLRTLKTLEDCHFDAIGKMSGCHTTEILPPLLGTRGRGV